MDNLYHAKIGEKVYWDTFAGMIKAVYLGNYHSQLFDRDEAIIKITATSNHTYNKGEIIHAGYGWVYPRVCFHKTGIFTFAIYPNFVFDR